MTTETTSRTPALADVPYADARLGERDRELLRATLHEVGTDPEQKFILGRRTAALEQALAEQAGARHAVACGSGTLALALALRAVGVVAGDEVIVPAFGAEPLAATVLSIGAVPVFADVDPLTMTIDPVDAESRVTEVTRAVVPAHLFTTMADMPAIRALARRHGLAVVEDAAVAQGAKLAGQAAGTWGDAGLYSFFPVKPFGMPGEGAVVVTDKPEISDAVRQLRNHGQDGVHRFVHHEIGVNSRFDEVLAGYQLGRLDRAGEMLARRAEIAELYSTRFAPLRQRGLLAPATGADGQCHYVYAVQTICRDALAAHLAAQGIGSRVYYPVPLPRLPAFAAYAGESSNGRRPGAELAAARHLALPLHLGLTDRDAERTADAVSAFFS
ncbi:DegT/DnrJ/EryC1/StrS family aminotransferase [Streptomyces physcomitrii]|uniref:DegT/DnrJ/EryC1/StrS family aminotransferase n=1 Tax=Streptomyces physcomitrii TaxID=2724184 RepID=A0ABX1H907_9ACTN|nr:DegT/DnrJ/EryC1/StrS family aminotransferase [Streptomyces physcomitrii]NKI44871.1 DegT/DnrJ/EryC1/StrS family aminotransferase [Streptomyces physcomitrii]